MQKTILLIEDNEQYAEVIKLHLEQTGAEDYISKLDDIETIWAQIDEKIERYA